jgi:hypothetical protein
MRAEKLNYNIKHTQNYFNLPYQQVHKATFCEYGVM